MLTDRYAQALSYTFAAHRGQVRKGTESPYVSHLLEVSATVMHFGGDEDTCIAALLHDAVEDQGGAARLADIEKAFGPRVAAMVKACSDFVAETPDAPKPDWLNRKEAYLARLPEEPPEVHRISAADKLSNVRAILRGLRDDAIGDRVWARFTPPRDKVIQYYERVVAILKGRVPPPLWAELSDTVSALRLTPGP